MAKTIALFNQSGGVGKTTLTMNLGYQLAARGHRVLLVDMDPQSSLTTFMGFDITEKDKTIYDALLGEEEEPLPILHAHQMSLSPANIILADAEQELVLAEQRELRLQSALAPVADQYDFILLDCPPSLGILSQISLVAANYILVPIQTQFKALMGTDSLLKTVRKIQRRLNKALKIAGFCPTMYSSGNALDQRTLDAITGQLAAIAPIFPPIPRATALAEASEYGKPLALSAKKNLAVLEILDEIANVLESL
ncbi:MAG: ParA family protein [Leptolyngbyaceae cyanobacterium bins.302]|nr:ParA family protein [Leptolyngbyaceae cyanobacterium bins.302]